MAHKTGEGIKAASWAHKLGFDIDRLKEKETKLSKGQDEEVSFVHGASFDRNEVISVCENDLNFLCSVAMPTVYKHNFPPVLLTAWELLTTSARAAEKLFPQIALGIPRGHAKTTLVKLFILYCILFTDKCFILVIGNTAKNAENIIADIVDMLDEDNIRSLFGDWKQGREIDRQDLKKFNFRSRTIVIAAVGAEGSIRGLNVKHMRPDVMIFEDVQTKECAESQLQSDSLERWMIGTAMKAKSPAGCIFIFVGNMYPGPNSILKKLKYNPTWIKFISGAILADGSALWEELHSIKDLVAELDNDIAMGHPEIFFSEVLNDTDAGINTKTDLSKLKDWNWTEVDRPQGKFVLIDPSTNKKGLDLTSIGVFEVYDEIPALRYLCEEDLSPGNTIRKALLYCIKYNIRLVVVESTAYQYTFLYWFNQVVKELGITGIECVDVYTGAYSKNSRITDMLKGLMTGEVVIHPSIRNLVTNQIANWNPLKRDNQDNILDLLAYAPKVLELYGTAIATEDFLTLEAEESEDVDNFNSAF